MIMKTGFNVVREFRDDEGNVTGYGHSFYNGNRADCLAHMTHLARCCHEQYYAVLKITVKHQAHVHGGNLYTTNYSSNGKSGSNKPLEK